MRAHHRCWEHNEGDTERIPVLTDTPSLTLDDHSGNSLNRVEKALALIDRDGLGLEIGPAYHPVAPRRDGYNVQIVDYIDDDTLREKFKDMGDIDIEQIEKVDFVWEGQPLPDLIGGRDRYDWIIASHVIEHLPDLLTFFNDCQEVLKPKGVLSLVVPDKRYCFDYFRPLTMTGGVLDAFEQHRIRPTPGSVFDNMVNCVTRKGQGSWSPTDEKSDSFQIVYSFETARSSWENAKRGYEDAHIWCFTPASFRLVLHDLRTLGLLSFDVVHEYGTAGNEFFVTLGQGAQATAVTDRVALLRQIEGELDEATQTPITAAAQANGSAPGVTLSPREERLIASKRRLVQKLREAFRR